MTAELIIACLVLGVWIYLVAFHGGFWLMHERDDADEPEPPRVWPSVAAIIPARDEASVLPKSIGSLLAQDYAGKFSIVVVDDQSSDATAAVARSLAANAKFDVAIVPGRALPTGWTGKVWAMHQGVAHVEAAADPPDERERAVAIALGRRDEAHGDRGASASYSSLPLRRIGIQRARTLTMSARRV